MASGQRSFVHKLNKQHAADARRQVGLASYGRSTVKRMSGTQSASGFQLCDMMEPLDYEDYIQQNKQLLDQDSLHHLLEFPTDDIDVGIMPRKCRTVVPILPDEESEVDTRTRDCVRCYTSDWIVVHRRYQYLSSSCAARDREAQRSAIFSRIPRQEFEVDTGDEFSSTQTLHSVSQHSLAQSDESTDKDSSCSPSSSTRHSVCLSETPRGSWASSDFDLRNSTCDPLVPSLLERFPAEDIDRLNEALRTENRQDAIFALYPVQEEEEPIERRMPADSPADHMGHRLLIKCLYLKFELEIEPMFASLALYDAKEKKKISENFNFDMNSESIKKMLSTHVPFQDISTLSRACVVNISHPSPDIFIVIRLEKILQGDITECAEPYMKDDKNRDKVKANAVATCERLGKYRMPFAWTAVYLSNVVNGVNSLEREGSCSDRDSTTSGSSLERKTSTGSYDGFRRKAGDYNSLNRRGSLERHAGNDKQSGWSAEEFGLSLDTFRPVTLTVSSFFKQEGDRLRDEDLFKYLIDLKRPSSALKRLKCLPGTLKLDISPCSEDLQYCLTPELVPLHPFPDDKARPIKELLEFPSKSVFVPHYVYRNLLYIYPKDVNFASRPGSARNITCKVQLMSGEEAHHALKVIFNKSSCPEFIDEIYTSVCYHNKSPDFYDEIKINLPAKLSDQHHLLFTFYHVSCQRKVEQNPIDLPIGFTWLPIFVDGRLQTGDYCLPIMLEQPPVNYSLLSPEVQLPGSKWLDNHKGLFDVSVKAFSSVHTQDPLLEHFVNLCAAVEEQNIPARLGEINLENEFKHSISNLANATIDSLVSFLPLVFDKLIQLLVEPVTVNGQLLNVGQTCFEAITLIVKKLSDFLEYGNDQHGRNNLLTTYIHYQCLLPHPSNAPSAEASGVNAYYQVARPLSMPVCTTICGRSTSNPDLAHQYIGMESEVAGLFTRGLDRTSSLRTAGIHEGTVCTIVKQHGRKTVHEEMALQWVVSNGKTRELALCNAWFYFELIVRSMTEHLAVTRQLNAPRKLRFSEQFTDDLTTLVTTMTSDIISRYNQESKDFKLVRSLNTSLAFFLYDLLSIMDRGYVFVLLKTYCKQTSAKIASLPDASQLVNLKLEFLRIVCSHEHYVTLNLPFGMNMPQSSVSGTTSPSPSTSSSSSSLLTNTSLVEVNLFTELTYEFRKQHYLVGLVLAELFAVLEMKSCSVHTKAINSVRNLLGCHDSDPRYVDLECRARVAALYLPLLGIVTDFLPRLYDWDADKKSNFMSSVVEDAEQSGIYRSVVMAIAGSPVHNRIASASTDSFMQNLKGRFSMENTRHLLLCFLWIIKNVDSALLKQWWSELSFHSLHRLLDVLYLAVSCFEYKGRKKSCKLIASQPIFRKTTDIKSKLEDVILGQGSARNEMIKRRDRHIPFPANVTPGDRLRWRKDQTQWRHPNDASERPKIEMESESHIEGNLATEANMIILDTLEVIVQIVSQLDCLQGLMGNVFRVLLHALACNQSTTVLQHLFATQRALVCKFPGLMFDEQTEQCADLCLQLLRHCSSSISSVRSQAAASLYMLMRQNFEIGNNFARVKMQVTMSLSSLVGTSHSFSEVFLRRSLKTILTYADADVDLQDTTFPEQVKDLVFNLHMILSDTVKMKEFQEDPEMLLDLMYRIAKGYQTSPDLRLTWLANMSQKHIEKNNQAEAAQCLVHSAALVAEYLHMLEDKLYLPVGAASFKKLSDNILEESAISDDVVSPDEEGICTGKMFSVNGLIGLLEQAAIAFNAAGLFEAVNDVYKILIPIAEAHRDFKKLATIHAKLHEAFSKIEHQAGKRVFGTYFRVGFYGAKFGDLDGEEFVYKEPFLTKLPEISHRLENFYSERFSPELVEMIKDSNPVDVSRLNVEKAYIQITYVEPYFDVYELRSRVTHFEKNYNIKRFIYATPFTLDGRAHGELHEQYKRKTILTTANSFPYVKTRIQVVERKQVVLTPIEVAIEDIQKKTAELALAIQQEPADPKILQMVLQGCLGTTVNQGPLEVAMVFLADLVIGKVAPSKHQNKLRLCFKDFFRRCSDALHKNKFLITSDQRNYQRELERNYVRMTEKLHAILQVRPVLRILESHA